MSDEHEAKWRALLRRAVALDPSHGSDLASDAWISLRGQLAHCDERYLVGTVRNLRRNQHRRDQRRARREDDWASATERPALDLADELERRELLRALQSALQKLHDSELRLLHDRYVAGKTSAQIAERARTTANTVRWRLKILVDQLRARLIEFLEVSMSPDREVLSIVRAIERCLDELSDEWSGRVVIHLAPSPQRTEVEKLELIPPAPRRINVRLKRRLIAQPLPGCSVPRPFEMHFECTAD